MAAFEVTPEGLARYDARPWRELVELWLVYNRHLVHLLWHADHNCAGNL